MNLCDDYHDEICFVGRSCPVCEKQREINALQDDIRDLQQKIKDMEEE